VTLIPSSQAGKAIITPFFASDIVVDKEKTCGIIFRVDRPQSWIFQNDFCQLLSLPRLAIMDRKGVRGEQWSLSRRPASILEEIVRGRTRPELRARCLEEALSIY
jgi:hypothetical protein